MQGTEGESISQPKGDASTATQLHEQLLQRGQKLLQDLEDLQEKTSSVKSSLDVSKFVREVRHELKLITKDKSLRTDNYEDYQRMHERETQLGAKDINGDGMQYLSPNDRVLPDSRLHRLRSSNLSFFEKIWDIAQKQNDITAIRKLVAWRPLKLVRENGSVSVVKSQRREKKKVMVDIMCEGGKKWIKVWTRSQKNLIMDMAKEGIVVYETDSEHEDSASTISDDATNDLQLVKLASSLIQAAKTVRLDFQHPTVIMMLPNVLGGEVADVDKVLEVVRELGAVVQCANSIEEQAVPAIETIPLKECLQRATMVNVDCTVLIALVSDISHYRSDDVQVPRHYQDSAARDIEEQLVSEVDKPLLPSNLFPKLSGKQLVCSHEAAEHLRSIIRVMGSKTEKQRAAIVLGDSRGDEMPSSQDALAALSVHEIPDNLRIPVTLVEATSQSCIQNCADRLQQAVMLELATKEWFSTLNQAVIFHGWLSNLHTMTINRAVARRVRKGIDDILDQLELEGQVNNAQLRSFSAPKFVICGRQRSLLGSEKGA